MMILNEKKYAEDLFLGRNDEVKSVTGKVGYVTRYQLFALGYSDEDNYMYAVKWMQKHHDNFDENCYSKLIADAVKRARKKPFFDVGAIKITRSELEIIAALDNLRAEKIMFVLLCMAKQQRVALGFTNGLVKYSLPDLCKTARISVPTDEREYILYEILQTGQISSPKKNDTQCLIVNFINEDDEPVLLLNETDCKELAYTYMNWKNDGGYDRCECCGRLFRKNRYRKYCHECAQYQQVGDKLLSCVDCGKEFSVDSRNMTKCRCDVCQQNADRENTRKRVQRYRENNRM